MGQQYNKVIKRRRRRAYLARKASLVATAKAATKAKPKARKPAGEKASTKPPGEKKVSARAAKAKAAMPVEESQVAAPAPIEETAPATLGTPVLETERQPSESEPANSGKTGQPQPENV